jgi:hypothetical protein
MKPLQNIRTWFAEAAELIQLKIRADKEHKTCNGGAVGGVGFSGTSPSPIILCAKVFHDPSQ